MSSSLALSKAAGLPVSAIAMVLLLFHGYRWATR
jgi:hypothetical protein